MVVLLFEKPKHKRKKKNREFSTSALTYCQYCGRTDMPIQRHHIVYRSQGGMGSDKNRIDLCPFCNTRAHSKDKGYQAKDLYFKAYLDRKRRKRIQQLLQS